MEAKKNVTKQNDRNNGWKSYKKKERLLMRPGAFPD